MINDENNYNGAELTNIGLWHYGILGMKWGVRRFQNKDGSLTEAGKKRYAQLKDAANAEEQRGNSKKAAKIRDDEIYKKGKSTEANGEKIESPEETVTRLTSEVGQINKDLDKLESRIAASENASMSGGKSAKNLQDLLDADEENGDYANWNKIRKEMVEKIGDPYWFTSSKDSDFSDYYEKAKTREIQDEVDRYHEVGDYLSAFYRKISEAADAKFGDSMLNADKKYKWKEDARDRTKHYEAAQRNRELYKRFLTGKALEALGYKNTEESRKIFNDYGIISGE